MPSCIILMEYIIVSPSFTRSCDRGYAYDSVTARGTYVRQRSTVAGGRCWATRVCIWERSLPGTRHYRPDRRSVKTQHVTCLTRWHTLTRDLPYSLTHCSTWRTSLTHLQHVAALIIFIRVHSDTHSENQILVYRFVDEIGSELRVIYGKVFQILEKWRDL